MIPSCSASMPRAGARRAVQFQIEGLEKRGNKAIKIVQHFRVDHFPANFCRIS